MTDTIRIKVRAGATFRGVKHFEPTVYDVSPDLALYTVAQNTATYVVPDGVAYVAPLECGTRKNHYTGYMVWIGGDDAIPHTGPLATREEAEALAAQLNGGAK